MDFGGPMGNRLAQLNRLVAVFSPFTRLPVGFGFIYDDGKDVFYGSRSITNTIDSQRPCVEMSFSIKGRLGERITEIQGLSWVLRGEYSLRGFKVRACLPSP